MASKVQIADRIAARGWTRALAGTAVDAVLDEISAALAAGERVTLTGFGTFEPAARAARSARNPRTGESIAVGATTVARFHPGATLRAAVASGEYIGRGTLAAAEAPGALDAAVPGKVTSSDTLHRAKGADDVVVKAAPRAKADKAAAKKAANKKAGEKAAESKAKSKGKSKSKSKSKKKS